MSKALEEIIQGKPTLLNKEQANMTLQQKLQDFAKKKGDAEKAKCQNYFDENKKRPGVISLPNGLQYEIIKAGEANGMKPTPVDTVVVDYVGTLIDGTEFDNSIKRGEPASFPLGGVIRGWTEILQLMTIGSHWKVYIPSELGYGERGAGGAIPPNAALIFEITLRDIKPAVTK
jgi:FKBP-type peptidyl-prolyl cis-trans isomerase FklB